MPEPMKGRKPEDILEEIERKLATIDGIAMSDAFILGRLIQEYGQTRSEQAMVNFLGPIMEKMTFPKPPSDEPWKDRGSPA